MIDLVAKCKSNLGRKYRDPFQSWRHLNSRRRKWGLQELHLLVTTNPEFMATPFRVREAGRTTVARLTQMGFSNPIQAEEAPGRRTLRHAHHSPGIKRQLTRVVNRPRIEAHQLLAEITMET